MSLSDVLTERSWRHLVEFVDYTLQPMLDSAQTPDERERIVQLYRIAGREFESILKLAVDRRDFKTLSVVDGVWSDAPADPWWVWDEDDASHGEDLTLAPIVRSRQISWMGIAMWASHEAARERDPEQRARLIEMLRLVGAHFDTLDRLFLVTERALEDEDSRPWGTWFLGQLPERQAHFIPTRQQIVLAALLLALDRVEEDSEVRPRRWMRDSWETIEETLGRIESEPERWEPVLGPEATVSTTLTPSDAAKPTGVSERARTLRSVLAAGKQAAADAEQDQIRQAEPDPTKIAQLRTGILGGFSEARLVLPLVRVADAVALLDVQPPDSERQMLRTWLSKELLVPEGRLVGIDFVASDVVRACVRAEVQELLDAVTSGAPEVGPSDVPLGIQVRQQLDVLRSAGNQPSLIVMPISWEARRSLDLESVSADLAAQLPPEAAKALEGTIDGVPVIDTPLLDDRLWALDLKRAVRWEEWPSDNDSGLSFALRFFDDAAARELLSEHPELREQGMSDEQSIRVLRGKAFLEVALSFRATPLRSDAAVQVVLPAALRRG